MRSASNSILYDNYKQDWKIQLKPFLFECQMFMHKKLYRKVYDDIDSKIINWDPDSKLYLDLLILKSQSLIKIISKRISKYDSSKFKSTEQWFMKLEKELKTFKEKYLSNTSSPFFLDNIEMYVQLCSETFYLMAIMSKLEGNYPDCICYLSMGDKLINSFHQNSVKQKTLFIFQNILIQISNFLIADNDFYEAINYQNKAINLCYRQLYLIVDIQSGLEVNIETLLENLIKKFPSTHRDYVSKFERLIVNCVTLLFHQGICLERVGMLTESLFNYTQARFFTEKYLSNTHSEFLEFILNIEDKIKQYKNLLLKIKSKNTCENQSATLPQSTNENVKKENLGEFHHNHEQAKSYETVKTKIENMILNLKPECVKEIELFSKRDNFTKYVAEMTHDNKLLSSLLTKDFKNIILKLKKVNTTKLDNQSYDMIQRKVTEIRNEEFVKSIEKMNGKANYITISENTEDANETSNLSINKPQKSHVTKLHLSNIKMTNENPKRSKSVAYPHKLNLKSVNSIFDKNAKFIEKEFEIVSKANTLVRLSKSKKYEERRPLTMDKEIRKYPHSDYILARSYRKKYALLENTSYRDNQFHKSVLHLKKDEIIPTKPTQSREELNNDVKEFFTTTLRARRMVLDDLKDRKNIDDRKKQKVERSAVMSLDVSKYKKYIKESKLEQNTSYYTKILNKFKSKSQIEYGKDRDSCDILNNKVSEVITKEIDEINKYIKVEKSKLVSCSDKKQSSQALIKYRSNLSHDLSSFVKRKTLNYS